MNIDDFTKLLLAIAVSFAIVIIAWGLFRILNNLANSIGDLRKAIQNTSSLSDYVLEDYLKAREQVYSFMGGIKDFKSSYVDPVRNVAKMAGVISPFVSKNRKNSEKAE